MRLVSCLKREYIEPQRQLHALPIAEVQQLLSSTDQQNVHPAPHFIFHTAFCASTYLSRCLDIKGKTVSLREPQILLDAANAKRLRWRSRSGLLDHRILPELALKLLVKHAKAGETLIIKPINSINNIMTELLRLHADSKALLLYTDARRFLLSTLKKGEGGKRMIRTMFDLIRCDFPHLSNLRLTDVVRMTDITVILTLWRLHIEQAEQALQQHSANGNLASLYGETVIEKPLESLQAINQYLELGLLPETLAEITAGKVRTEDAKHTGQSFSLSERDKIHHRIETFYAGELNQCLQWLTKNNPETRLIPRLGSPLSV